MDFSSEKYIPSSLPEVCTGRGGVLDKIDEMCRERLLYIQAPAGYGKTVTANLWLQRNGARHVWISLDEYDNNPELFYRLLCSAVNAAGRRRGSVRYGRGFFQRAGGVCHAPDDANYVAGAARVYRP